MGQAMVLLPDGREMYIAGEHEDFYDPDFFIYNDVVIVDGESVAIFGYPVSDFPPTDFHTADLVGKHVYLIGNLGYPDDRKIGETQVLRLDSETREIFHQPTFGQNPEWLSKHLSVFDEASNSIRISGGNRFQGRLVENFHEYELCLDSFIWKITKRRNWHVWILEREDGNANQLWEIRTEGWMRSLGLSSGARLNGELVQADHELETEAITDRQIEEIENLYCSPFDNSIGVEDEEGFWRYRILVNDVTVRFDEDMFGVTVTVEGDLPAKSTDALVSQLQQKLESIETTAYKIISIET